MINWRPNAQEVWWWIKVAGAVIVVLLCVLLILYIISLISGVKLMDLLKVLAVPITVGAAVPLLNWLQKKRELDIADQRAQDDTLQAYLDQMAQLMLIEEADEAKSDEAKPKPFKPKPLRKSVRGDEVRILARARTLTVLRRLGSGRKRNVLDFLYEANLIQHYQPIIELGSPDIEYSAADLSGADLRGAVLRGACLSGPQTGVNLSGADLRGSDLSNANLSNANMSNADLSNANLWYANLSSSNLGSTNLSGANLSGADLRGAYEVNDDGDRRVITGAELEQQVKTLERATMPDGQKYEEWLKSREGEGG